MLFRIKDQNCSQLRHYRLLGRWCTHGQDVARYSGEGYLAEPHYVLKGKACRDSLKNIKLTLVSRFTNTVGYVHVKRVQTRSYCKVIIIPH